MILSPGAGKCSADLSMSLMDGPTIRQFDARTTVDRGMVTSYCINQGFKDSRGKYIN